jgi:PKD repeat protein
VNFTADVSGGAAPFNYAWNFGDGQAGAGQNPSHTFTLPDVYQTQLVVTDNTGQRDTAFVQIIVNDTAGQSFCADPLFGNAGNYTPKTASRWEVALEGGDKRYFLNTSSYSADGDKLGEYVILSGRPFGDFTIKFDAKSGDDIGSNSMADFAFIFGFQDQNNYYYVIANATSAYNEVFRVQNGTRLSLGRASAVLIPDNQYHAYEIERKIGSHIKVRMDNNEVLSIADDPSFKTGSVGFGSYNDAAYFDNITGTGSTLLAGPTGHALSRALPRIRFPMPYSTGLPIWLHLPDEARSIRLVLFNSSGQRIHTILERRQMAAGVYPLYFPGTRSVGSGIYIIRLTSQGHQTHRKIVIIR